MRASEEWLESYSPRVVASPVMGWVHRKLLVSGSRRWVLAQQSLFHCASVLAVYAPGFCTWFTVLRSASGSEVKVNECSVPRAVKHLQSVAPYWSIRPAAKQAESFAVNPVRALSPAADCSHANLFFWKPLCPAAGLHGCAQGPPRSWTVRCQRLQCV